MTKVYVEQPLAFPGSSNDWGDIKTMALPERQGHGKTI